MDLDIDLPTSNTRLELNVADKGATDMAKDLILIANLLYAVGSGHVTPSGHGTYYFTISGEQDFPSFSIVHQSWKASKPDFDSGSLILGATFDGENTRFELDESFVTAMIMNLTAGQWAVDHRDELVRAAKEALGE